MTPSEFTALRERCFSLVNGALKQKYKPSMFDDLIDLMVLHQQLPDAPLVVTTYQGIIGYHTWLQQEGRDRASFLPDALHDLAECVRYDRDDGYSPRTGRYAEFYTLFSAYYFPQTPRLLVYAGTEMVLNVSVTASKEVGSRQGFRYNGLYFDAHLSRCGGEDSFSFSIFPIEQGFTQTGQPLPVTFHLRKPRFRIGDKVRFTEQAIGRFDLGELWAQAHREKEYEVLGFIASPENEHLYVTVRHTAEDDAQDIAEYNLTD